MIVAHSKSFQERAGGIEPPSLAWKAKVLPLNYTRKKIPGIGLLSQRAAPSVLSLL